MEAKVAKMVFRCLCLIVLSTCALWAQLSTFPTLSYFREQWARPPINVQIEAPSRLGDFLIDNQLQLSLRSYLELVMINNPNINLQKLAVYEQQNAIQRAFSPFDPALSLSFTGQRSTTPSIDQLAGAAVRSTLAHNAGIGYDQTFDTGTSVSIDFTGNRTGDNSSFVDVNPSLRHTLQFTFNQPLLRDRGRFIQRVPILIAESRLEQTEAQVREQVINLLSQAESAYWTVVEARENLRVAENNLALRKAFLERSHLELKLGAIPALDIYQPEQQFASAQVGVTQALYRLQQAEDVIRRWIGADLDPAYKDVALQLTESADPPAATPPLDREAEVAKALSLRPELEQLQRALEIDDLNIRASTNDLRPDLRLTGSYRSTGLAGVDRSSGVAMPIGWTRSLEQIFGFDFPTYSMGLTLNLPLRNRAAAADLSDATLQKKRDLYNMRSQVQFVRQEVVNAVAGVEQAKAALEQATRALDFAQKRVDGEQQKYDLGAQVAFFVLEAQTDLAAAQSDVVSQSIAYRRSMLDLLQATGELLEARGVAIRYD
jgi:outer membrane protein TolC